MEELITNNTTALGILIFMFGCGIYIACVLILKTVVDIKKMLKEHFGDDKKKEA